MNYFRAAYLKNEISERSLELSAVAIELNPANYTAWYFRRLCLFALRDRTSLKDEFSFVSKCAANTPKNYQIWFHRRMIVEKTGDPSLELAETRRVLLGDAKNYHAWSHRQWALKTFDLWKGEMKFVDELIQEDPRNNSAWNQRWFVVHNANPVVTPEIRAREMAFALKHMSALISNECPYAYLRGLLKGHTFSAFPIVRKTVESLRSRENDCAPLLALHADILVEAGRLERAREIYKRLAEEVDTIRRKYWRYLESECMSNEPVRRKDGEE